MVKRLTRRRFLRTAGFGSLFGIALGPTFALAQKVFAKPKTPNLVIARGEDPAKQVRAALEKLGGIGRFVKKGFRVFLKPNMSFPNEPAWGNNTHPEVVAAVAESCLEAGAAKVFVFDHPLRLGRFCLEKSGNHARLASLRRVILLCGDRPIYYKRTPVPQGVQLRSVDLAKELLKADLFINLPIAKSHNATKVSLGLKNLLGVVWDRGTFHRDIDLHQGIADLATVARPALTIMDATRCLATNGPTGPGKQVTPKLILAGTDPVAVDTRALSLSFWNEEKVTVSMVGYIRAAEALGLGTTKIDTLSIAEI